MAGLEHFNFSAVLNATLLQSQGCIVSPLTYKTMLSLPNFGPGFDVPSAHVLSDHRPQKR